MQVCFPKKEGIVECEELDYNLSRVKLSSENYKSKEVITTGKNFNSSEKDYCYYASIRGANILTITPEKADNDSK